jgi:hypothetical protein
MRVPLYPESRNCSAGWRPQKEAGRLFSRLESNLRCGHSAVVFVTSELGVTRSEGISDQMLFIRRDDAHTMRALKKGMATRMGRCPFVLR